MIYAKLLKYMQDGTLTCPELAEATGLNKLTVYYYTRAMHKEGVIHICDWDGDTRSAAKIYRLGQGQDLKRPRKSKAQVYADYKARKKARLLQARITGGLHAVSSV